MKPSLKTLFLTITLLVYVVFYALLVMALMNSNLKPQGGLAEGLAYAFAGFAWLPIAMVIIKFMEPKKQ
jgi:Protein of unknown function (DUF2842)